MNKASSRLENVVSYANEFGVEEASDHFNLAITTIKRYQRKAREQGVISGSYDNPRILLFDIETAPMEFYGWRTGKQYVSEDKIIKDISILSWSGKWLMQDEVFSHKVTPEEARDRDDLEITEKLYDVFEDADILVAHNVDRFDSKIANTRFILNGFSPPSSYRTIDTLKVARKHFNFPSNKLDYLSQILVGDEKLETSFKLWKRCVNGDSTALQEMLEYNIKDVRLLEEVYLKLRPWIKGGNPNLGLYYDDPGDRCPNCGHKGMEEDGYYYTGAGRYIALRCTNCGAYGRSRYNDLTLEQKEDLFRNQAH